MENPGVLPQSDQSYLTVMLLMADYAEVSTAQHTITSSFIHPIE
jgi:hypothetical protein